MVSIPLEYPRTNQLKHIITKCTLPKLFWILLIHNVEDVLEEFTTWVTPSPESITNPVNKPVKKQGNAEAHVRKKQKYS